MARLFITGAIILGIVFLAWQLLERNAAFSGTQENGSAQAANASYSYSNASEDMIFVTSPKPGDHVSGTIIIKGFARGGWYFEGVFPVAVDNAAGVTIGETQATADGQWTTESFVPFTAEVALKTTYTGTVTIVLKKDNPSGDPSRDASVSFPVVIQ